MNMAAHRQRSTDRPSGWPAHLRPCWRDLPRLAGTWASGGNEPPRNPVDYLIAAFAFPTLALIVVFTRLTHQLASVQPSAFVLGGRGPMRPSLPRMGSAVAVLVVSIVLLVPPGTLILLLFPTWVGFGASALIVVATGARVLHRPPFRPDWRETWALMPVGKSVELGNLVSTEKGRAQELARHVLAHALAEGWTLVVVPADAALADTYVRYGFRPVHDPGAGKPYFRPPETPLPAPAPWTP